MLVELCRQFSIPCLKIIFLLALLCVGSCSHKESHRGNNIPVLITQMLTIDGQNREYQYFTPNPNVASQPLVILLHGNGGTIDAMTGANNRPAPYRLWLDLAAQYQFAVAIPQGALGSNNKPGWNDCRQDATTNPTTDDVAFISSLIDQMQTELAIDTSRVYVTGTSNGGHMAIRLGIELRNKVAAVAPVVAAMPVNDKCIAASPQSILFMNGTDDPILPYAGGTIGEAGDNRGVVYSLTDSAWQWISTNGGLLSSTSENLPDLTTRDNSTVSRDQFNTNDGNEVVVYTVHGGGHTEPSLVEQYSNVYELIVGEQNHDIEMADAIWEFFQNKSN